MRVVFLLFFAGIIGVGCAHPVPVHYPDLSKPRHTRVNLRSNGNELYSSNYLGHASDLPIGSPAVVTMFSAQEVRLTVHGAAYVMKPHKTPFDTSQLSIGSFLDKYFVDNPSQIDVASLGPADLKTQVESGQHVIGMTKEQIYACLGPPATIDSDLPTANLSREQIMASDKWVYLHTLVVFVPTSMQFVFHDNKLQTVIH